jgi:hypothetical protein
MSIKTKQHLVKWGTGSAEKRAKLQTAQDVCIDKMLNGLGSQLNNANTNGNSFGVTISMSYEAYFGFLADVLEHIDNGTMPTNRAAGGFGHYA